MWCCPMSFVTTVPAILVYTFLSFKVVIRYSSRRNKQCTHTYELLKLERETEFKDHILDAGLDGPCITWKSDCTQFVIGCIDFRCLSPKRSINVKAD